MAQKTKKLSSSYEESEYKNEFVKSSKSDIENDTNSKDLKKQTSNEKNFKDFGFKESILKSLEQKGYVNPTPIQRAAIPELMQGRDLLGQAQTGTGKTAAFALPIIDKLDYQDLIVLNLDSVFCDSSICRFYSDDEYFYVDDAHLGHYGATKVASFIMNEINNIDN